MSRSTVFLTKRLQGKTASDEASHITGGLYLIDSGRSAL